MLIKINRPEGPGAATIPKGTRFSTTYGLEYKAMEDTIVRPPHRFFVWLRRWFGVHRWGFWVDVPVRFGVDLPGIPDECPYCDDPHNTVSEVIACAEDY